MNAEITVFSQPSGDILSQVRDGFESSKEYLQNAYAGALSHGRDLLRAVRDSRAYRRVVVPGVIGLSMAVAGCGPNAGASSVSGIGGYSSSNSGECTVTILSATANVRSSAETRDANGNPSLVNRVGTAVQGTTFPSSGSVDGQAGNAGDPSGTDRWYKINFNGASGFVNETTARSTCP